jgi:transposase-like protein
MKCPKCGNENYCKDGVIKGVQRYRSKECNYHYTVIQKSNVKSAEMRRLALEMYLEGLGFRSIGRVLKISYGTVYQWVKKYGEKNELPQKKEPVKIVELDEMHT